MTAGLALAAPRLAATAVSLAHNDQLHYGGHLVAGRILALSPYTSQLAETQYARGMYHARTPRQVALLTTDRPTSLRARLAEAPRLAALTLHYLSSRLAP